MRGGRRGGGRESWTDITINRTTNYIDKVYIILSYGYCFLWRSLECCIIDNNYDTRHRTVPSYIDDSVPRLL